jgi:hypothetical protein
VRYPVVPWLSESDFVPAGGAEWTVEKTDMIALGWVVRHPFGPQHRIMVITAMRGNGNDGGVIMLALKDAIDIDTHETPVRNIQHSRTFHEGDWE